MRDVRPRTVRCHESGQGVRPGKGAGMVRNPSAHENVRAKARERGWIGNVACKALCAPLSFALIAGCSSLPVYALASEGASDLRVASVAAESPLVLTAAEAPTSLYSAYLPVLFRAANGLGEFAESYQSSDAEQWSPEYFLFDVAGDGTPELMVRTNSFNGVNLVHVFSVKSGKAVQIGSYWEWFGGSAGNEEGDLFAAGWNEGSSYVNAIRLEDGKVTTTFLKSGKATESNPNGDVEAVNAFLASRNAGWIDSSVISDYALLAREARYSLSKGTLAVAAAGAYTGDAKTPSVLVKFGGTTLVQGSDYEVSYRDNVNAGVATVTVSGVGDFRGSLSTRFTIARADLSKAEASLASAGAYTGFAKTPAATVRVGSAALVAGVDYGISYQNNVNAGKATATVFGMGNYEGSKSMGFSIEKANIEDAALSVASAGAYTGLAKAPAVGVAVGGRKLVADTDFKVSYRDNRNAGKAMAVVEGRGNYQGTKMAAFTIARADISSATASMGLAGAYSGSEKKPAATVKMLGGTLRANSDYTVSYKNNVNAGKATAIISGQGNYQGSKLVSFRIERADISKAAISIASGGVYSGSPKKPKATVRSGAATLRAGVDYLMSYKNNQNAGTAHATVSGKGNYQGSKKLAFAIAKANNPLALKSATRNVRASAVAKKAQTLMGVTIAKKPQGKMTFKNASSASVAKVTRVNKSSGAITVKKGAKKGVYKVKVSVAAAGNGNYLPMTKAATVKVIIK